MNASGSCSTRGIGSLGNIGSGSGGVGDINDAVAIAVYALGDEGSSVLLAGSSDVLDRSLTEWESVFHISFLLQRVRLPLGTHTLRASLSCAGSAVADSPVMTIKCNDKPRQFDAEAGSCRWAAYL